MRAVIVGGPRTGKSTLAREYRAKGVPTFCGDPRSLCKEPEEGVTYLPEGLSWSEGSQWIVDNWMSSALGRRDWVMEGQIMARALRKWMRTGLGGENSGEPCDRIIVLTEPKCEQTPGQVSMCKAVETVWREISWRFEAITEYR